MNSAQVSEGEGTAQTGQSLPLGGGLVKLGIDLYRQVAAIIAAFALIALLGDFIDFEWRGFLETLVGQWNMYVRPPVKLVLHTLISRPLDWLFSWHFEVPLLVRDYVAVGTVLSLAQLRYDRFEDRVSLRSSFKRPLKTVASEHGERASAVRNLLQVKRASPSFKATRTFVSIAQWLLIMPLVWPLSVVSNLVLVRAAFKRIQATPIESTGRPNRRERRIADGRSGLRERRYKLLRMTILTLAPILYVGLLVLVNYFFLSPTD